MKTTVQLEHAEYVQAEKSKREDNTSIIFENNVAQIIVGDSKEGWAQALELYFKILWDKMYSNVYKVKIVYNYVRPKGERLKRFGGTASGHESLKDMFEKIHSVITNAGEREKSERVNLRPIDCLDIANHRGKCCSGGVRRTSEIGLFGIDDKEIMDAKQNLYYQNNEGEWVANEKYFIGE